MLVGTEGRHGRHGSIQTAGDRDPGVFPPEALEEFRFLGAVCATLHPRSPALSGGGNG
jgi:hypothetical protein